MTPTCATCRYWDREHAECHRYPPTFAPSYYRNTDGDWMPIGVPNAHWWPYAGPDDWCGEHAPREGG